jgi:hypothetical protein
LKVATRHAGHSACNHQRDCGSRPNCELPR